MSASSSAWPRHDRSPGFDDADYLVDPDPAIGAVVSAETNRRRGGGFYRADWAFRKVIYEVSTFGLMAGWVAGVLAQGGSLHLASLWPWSSTIPVHHKVVALGYAVAAALLGALFTLALRRPRSSYVGEAGIQIRIEPRWGGGRTQVVAFADCAQLKVMRSRQHMNGFYLYTMFTYAWFDHRGRQVLRLKGRWLDRGSRPPTDLLRLALAAEQAWYARRGAQSQASSAGAATAGGAAILDRPAYVPGPSSPSGPSGPSGSPSAPPGARTGSGCDVTLPSMSYATPSACASCGARPDTTLAAVQSRGFGAATRSLPIPYCRGCAARIRSARSLERLLCLAMLGVAPGCAAIGFAVPELSLGVLGALATGAAVAIAAVLRARLSRAARGAVRLVSFRGFESVLYCPEPGWAGLLARSNGTTARPRARRGALGARSLVIAGLFAPAAAVVVWLGTHHRVFVDNAGTAPLTVWVDGAAVTTVEPRRRFQPPPSVFVAYGRHRFGYSAAGASAPSATVDGVVIKGHDLLYNPGATACYTVAAFGSSPRPEPVTELHVLGEVGSWFTEGQDGTARPGKLAIERDEACRKP